jgi:hypothetical protein
VTAPELDPERAFVGAILHLQAPTARRALALVDDDDIGDPPVRSVLEHCRALAEADVDPFPTVVLARMRSHGEVTAAGRISSAGELLTELFAGVAVPAAWQWLAVATLDEAIRRRSREGADRIGQASEGSPLDIVTDLWAREAAAVDVLRRRRDAAAPTGPRLAAVKKAAQ